MCTKVNWTWRKDPQQKIGEEGITGERQRVVPLIYEDVTKQAWRRTTKDDDGDVGSGADEMATDATLNW